MIEPGASLIASALTSGKGGFIETSGDYLAVNGINVNVNSPSGIGGTWLLDPFDLSITTADNNVTASSPFEPTGTASTLSNTTLDAALNGTNGTIVVETTNTGTGTGDITVSAPVNWASSATLLLQSINDIIINDSITGTNGSLQISAGSATNTITTGTGGAIDVANFNLLQGIWSQVSNPLPAFVVTNNFQINSGTLPNANAEFIRALNGLGTTVSPYEITDIYGLQGIGSDSTTLADNYVIDNAIDASGTANWNSGAGFIPIGNTTTPFSGTIAGLGGQVFGISNLIINDPSTANIGLFGVNTGSIQDISITSGTITGQNNTGALIGFNNGGTASTLLNAASVNGAQYTGGIIGFNTGSLQIASNSGAINGSDTFLGGIAGYNDGTINETYNTGTIGTTTSMWMM